MRVSLKQIWSLNHYFLQYIFSEILQAYNSQTFSPANIQNNNSFQCWQLKFFTINLKLEHYQIKYIQNLKYIYWFEGFKITQPAILISF